MEPETAPIPYPDDRGDSARRWLESQGLVPRVPPIRSSQYELLLGDPFCYYLACRLGIVPVFSYSTAKTRGTWYHTMLQASTTEDPGAFTAGVWAARSQEIRALSKLGLLPQAIASIEAREMQDRHLAQGWFEAAQQVRMRNGRTLPEHFAKYRVVASERVLRYWFKVNNEEFDLVMTADQLLYDPSTKSLAIRDDKTCSEPAPVRLTRCPLEMQTLLYSFIVKELLEDGTLQEDLKLPSNTVFGGMFHVAVQKPTIRLSGEDRDSSLETKILKGGPNKGESRTEKVFFGEPKLANYIGRCLRWYRGEDEYQHRDPSEVPVDVSWISPSILTPLTMKDLFARLSFINSHARRPANPDEFLMNPRGVQDFGGRKPSTYASFYMNPVTEWPRIIAEERFIIDHRDDPAQSED